MKPQQFLRAAAPATVVAPVADAGGRRRYAILLALASLVLMQLSWMEGYSVALDIHVWDELVYLWMVRDALLADGVVDWAWCPLYSLAYLFLDCWPCATHVPDIMFVGLSVVLPAVFWWATAPMLGIVPSWLCAVWMGCSPLVVPRLHEGAASPSGVYAFTAALAYVAIGAVSRGKLQCGLCLMALASLTRAEYSPWLAVFGLLVAAQAKGPFAIWRRAWIVLLAITPFVVGVAHPDFRARSWLAFKQHYGQKAQVEALEHEWRESQGNVSPQRIQEALHELEMSFAEPDRWIAKDFGAAGSPLEALSANPKRFLWHVSNVIGGLPLSLAIAFSAWFAPWLHYSWLSLMICVLAAFGWGLPVGPARMLCVGAMMHVKLLLVCSPLALLASLMVGARPELALPVVPAIMVCVGGGVVRWITLLTQSRASKAGCDPCPTLGSESEAKPVAGVGDWIDVGLRRSPARHGSGAESAALATVAAVVGLVGMLVGGPFRDPDKPTAYRDGLTLLESGLPAEAKRVLTNYWRMPLRLIHRPDLQPIWPSLGPTDSLSVFLQQHRVDAIHVNPALLFQLRNVPDAFQAVQGGGWRLAGQKGSSMLYVREPL